MTAKTIEEFFGTLQQATVESWREHLKTNKYSAHMALDEFYKEMPEKVDTLIEDYMGIYGKLDEYKNVMTTDKMDAVDYLKELRVFVSDSRKKLIDENDTELWSDIDDIMSLIDSTLYKLKELKENANSSKSLKDFLLESLED